MHTIIYHSQWLSFHNNIHIVYEYGETLFKIHNMSENLSIYLSRNEFVKLQSYLDENKEVIISNKVWIKRISTAANDSFNESVWIIPIPPLTKEEKVWKISLICYRKQNGTKYVYLNLNDMFFMKIINNYLLDKFDVLKNNC